MRIFKPADILLPIGDMHRWSVVACDQFTSDVCSVARMGL